MKKEKGFTLVELLTYIAILGIILVALISFLYWVVRAKSKLQANFALESSAHFMLNRLEREIRSAEGVYTPTTSSNQLSLHTRRDVASGEESTYIDFYLCGDKLCMKKEFENPVSLTGEEVSVQNLNFEGIEGNPPSMKIDMELFCDSFLRGGDDPPTLNISTIFSLRR